MGPRANLLGLEAVPSSLPFSGASPKPPLILTWSIAADFVKSRGLSIMSSIAKVDVRRGLTSCN